MCACGLTNTKVFFLAFDLLFSFHHPPPSALFVGGLRKGRLVLPASYTALGDDLDVQLHADPLELATVERLRLEISRHLPGSGTGTVATTLDLRVDANHNVTQIKVPCYHFLHGGHYELAVLEENASHQMDERLRQPLNVSWPPVRLAIVPNRTETYPEQQIQGLLEFPQAHCQLPAHGADTLDLPELWLELFYCGKSVESCTVHGNGSQPFSRAQVLYTEQVRGLPHSRTLNFRCDLFGLAGFYALHLKPRPGELADPTMASLLQARALLQTDWSKQYVFTVHTRSIFPCDPHGPGIRVLFQYPACILNQADRVRVYAKLRADVLSLAPPTSLHYIAEQRVSKGQHSLYFECDLFYEKFVEYCFVYVSQAISGAVADIRMDCVPTLPVSGECAGQGGRRQSSKGLSDLLSHQHHSLYQCQLPEGKRLPSLVDHYDDGGLCFPSTLRLFLFLAPFFPKLNFNRPPKVSTERGPRSILSKMSDG